MSTIDQKRLQQPLTLITGQHDLVVIKPILGILQAFIKRDDNSSFTTKKITWLFGQKINSNLFYDITSIALHRLSCNIKNRQVCLSLNFFASAGERFIGQADTHADQVKNLIKSYYNTPSQTLFSTILDHFRDAEKYYSLAQTMRVKKEESANDIIKKCQALNLEKNQFYWQSYKMVFLDSSDHEAFDELWEDSYQANSNDPFKDIPDLCQDETPVDLLALSLASELENKPLQAQNYQLQLFHYYAKASKFFLATKCLAKAYQLFKQNQNSDILCRHTWLQSIEPTDLEKLLDNIDDEVAAGFLTNIKNYRQKFMTVIEGSFASLCPIGTASPSCYLVYASNSPHAAKIQKVIIPYLQKAKIQIVCDFTESHPGQDRKELHRQIITSDHVVIICDQALSDNSSNIPELNLLNTRGNRNVYPAVFATSPSSIPLPFLESITPLDFSDERLLLELIHACTSIYSIEYRSIESNLCQQVKELESEHVSLNDQIDFHQPFISNEQPEIAIPDNYSCIISGLILFDPVVTAYNRIYEREEIEKWFKEHDTDPKTNNVVSDKTLRAASFEFRQMVKEFLDKHPKHWEQCYIPESLKSQIKKAIDEADDASLRSLIKTHPGTLLESDLIENESILIYACRQRSGIIYEQILKSFGKTFEKIPITTIAQACCEAATYGHPIKSLLEKSNHENHAISFMFHAIERSEIAGLRELLNLYASPNAFNTNGVSLLSRAVEVKNSALVHLLVQKGANADSKDPPNQSPRDQALALGDTEILKAIESKDFVPPTPIIKTGSCPNANITDENASYIREHPLIELLNQSLHHIESIYRRVNEGQYHIQGNATHRAIVHHASILLLQRTFMIIGLMSNDKGLVENHLPLFFQDTNHLNILQKDKRKCKDCFSIRNELMHWPYKYIGKTTELFKTLEFLVDELAEPVAMLKSKGRLTAEANIEIDICTLPLFSTAQDQTARTDAGQWVSAYSHIDTHLKDFKLLYEASKAVKAEAEYKWEQAGHLHLALAGLTCEVGQRIKDIEKPCGKQFMAVISTFQALFGSRTIITRQIGNNPATGFCFTVDRHAFGHQFSMISDLYQEGSRPSPEDTKLLREFAWEILSPNQLFEYASMASDLIDLFGSITNAVAANKKSKK